MRLYNLYQYDAAAATSAATGDTAARGRRARRDRRRDRPGSGREASPAVSPAPPAWPRPPTYPARSVSRRVTPGLAPRGSRRGFSVVLPAPRRRRGGGSGRARGGGRGGGGRPGAWRCPPGSPRPGGPGLPSPGAAGPPNTLSRCRRARYADAAYKPQFPPPSRPRFSPPRRDRCARRAPYRDVAAAARASAGSCSPPATGCSARPTRGTPPSTARRSAR